ncbi:MAG: N-acetylmuramoyl-L-alanine amidase [Candidatus Methylomirabilis oxyfera]|nr:N-acetylmuramoyl-L-alanine amidase [Candidatus Methylomirabilis oxyfera]
MRLVALRIVFCAVLLGLAISFPAEAARVRVHLGKQLLTLTTVELNGVEYLSLANVAKATGGSLQRLPGSRTYSLRFPKSSITVKEGSSDIRVAGKTVSLSESSRRIGRAIAAPVELLPIALEERYGEGRVHWDPKARMARILLRASSLRLLRFRSYPDHTRVVLEGTRRHDFVLKNDGAGRVMLEIRRGVLGPSIRSAEVNDGVLVSIDPRQSGRDSRVIMKVTQRVTSSDAFALVNPHRIVVDLFSRGQDAPRRLAADETASSAKSGHRTHVPAAIEPARTQGPSPPTESVTTVVIDPGHGGRDPGAIGPSGIREKDVVLDIGLRLKRMVEERLGMQVVMTRSGDVFVPLEERAAIANRHKADFFISLHLNAAPHSRAIGSETYFLSREPSDRGARASAVRENTVLNLEGIGLKEQEGLKAILWDMAQTFYVRESSELAELLLNELGHILKVNNRGVKSAPFFVLIGAAMPSVLVEAAFVTNPSEEQRLQREAFRQQIAKALMAGITKFRDRYEKRLGMLPGKGSGE